MAFFTGRTGSLSFGVNTAAQTEGPSSALTAPTTVLPVAKIRDWSLDTTVELISTNSIDSGFNTFTPGVKGATGSATLVYYRLSAAEATAGELSQFTGLLNRLMKTGNIEESDRAFFELNVGGNNADDIKFWGYITSASVSVSTNELSVVPIQFTMDGDFVETITA